VLKAWIRKLVYTSLPMDLRIRLRRFIPS